MAKVRHKNTDKVSRRQGKAFLFASCSLFRLLNTFVLQIPIQTLIILTDRDAKITLLAWGTSGFNSVHGAEWPDIIDMHELKSYQH